MFNETYEFLMDIFPIKNRLYHMSQLSDLCHMITEKKGYYYNSKNFQQFKCILDAGIKRIRVMITVSRTMFQGAYQKDCLLSLLSSEMLEIIALNTVTDFISSAANVREAKLIFKYFFSTPPSPYSDGYSQLPLSLSLFSPVKLPDGCSPLPVAVISKR